MKAALIGLALIFAGEGPPQEPTRNAAGWLALAEESNLDGSKSFIAGKDALEPTLNTIGRPETPSLNVMCVNQTLYVSLSWPAFLGVDEVLVDASIDRGRIHRWTFQVPTGGNRQAVFGGSGNWRRFTTAVADGERITFRVHAYQGTQEATFDLTGISDVMQVAAQTCSA